MKFDVTRPLAITMGDAAGIGPEIIARAIRLQPDVFQATLVAGDIGSMRRAAALCSYPGELPLPIVEITSIEDAVNAPPGCIPVMQIGARLPVVPFGKVSAEAGEFAGRCVLWATRAALRGDISAMVTAPLHKEALSAAGYPYNRFPGHTEMLQDEAAAHLGKPLSEVPVRMMLANDELRTVLVSIHVSMREAIEAVTLENVFETIRITHAALTPMLGRPPRIAVAGLNPHAGEGGLFGREELEIIAPALDRATRLGIQVSGPWAPDTVFMRARSGRDVDPEFDVVVAMYHDQGLIPVKYLGVEKGVNVTLGLPLIRTSPDHGTAFDIAGTGRADPSSLLAAVHMARILSNA